MKKCALILPYFGRFPNYFPLFLRTVASNPSFDLLLFTDNEEQIDYPSNVRSIPSSLGEIKSRIEKHMGFEVCLRSAYKLCDYKPTYGLIFEDYLREYEYWGHCDCDLLFGDLENLLLPLLDSKQYDKLFAAGHLTLYRNDPHINRLFMSPYRGQLLYQQAFTRDEIFVFDEDCKEDNVHRIFVEEGATIYDKDLSMNPTQKKARFVRSYYFPEQRGFVWEDYTPRRYIWDGRSVVGVQSSKGRTQKIEYLYLHLQSRVMRMDSSVLDADVVEILPERFKARKEVPDSLGTWDEFVLRLPSLYHVRRLLNKVIKKVKRMRENINC